MMGKNHILPQIPGPDAAPTAIPTVPLLRGTRTAGEIILKSKMETAAVQLSTTDFTD